VCYVFPPKNTSALPAPLRDYVFAFSRKGAKLAKNFYVYFVLIPNTFAGFMSWREFICFFLSQRRRERRELQCLIYSYTKHLCVLCVLARFSYFLSRKGAEAAKNFNAYFVLIPNTFSGFMSWREFICFFLSQRRRGRRELQCLIYSYTKHLCVLCVLARFSYLLSRRGAEVAENFIV